MYAFNHVIFYLPVLVECIESNKLHYFLNDPRTKSRDITWCDNLSIGTISRGTLKS